MTSSGHDVLIGIDAGTSVIKSVAFDLAGRQIAIATAPNRYTTRNDGAAFQSLDETWADCAKTLRTLAEIIPDVAKRTAALAVTAQGDGTWLVGQDDQPVTDGWIWLDSRSVSTVNRLRKLPTDRARFETTGTGLNACQMSAQLAHMHATTPEFLVRAEKALHPKDWLYLNLTGQRVTDPSEANFTFGNFRTRRYDPEVIASLGLTKYRHLLPEIIDGSHTTHKLSARAAKATGLLEGTPVSLGYVDVVCTALGAGIYTGGQIADGTAGCTIIGSTGMHMLAKSVEEVVLNTDATGYVMVLPLAGKVAQVHTNMASTLNIDWILKLAADIAADLAQPVSKTELLARIDGWLAATEPGSLIYHPYISESGERGPFVDPNARASFIGLNGTHRFPDLVRAVIEGLGLAARDCYTAMGVLPSELRLTGGASRSRGLRAIHAAAIGAPTRISAREETGAAGAAMMAAVANDHYASMEDCIAEWVTPLLGDSEPADPSLSANYAALYPNFLAARRALSPVWEGLANRQDRKK